MSPGGRLLTYPHCWSAPQHGDDVVGRLRPPALGYEQEGGREEREPEVEEEGSFVSVMDLLTWQQMGGAWGVRRVV